MRATRHALRRCTLLLLITGVGCNGDPVTVPTRATLEPRFSIGVTLNVSDVEQLYTAVNNSANSGAAIVLAPGTYVLSATKAGVARPNNGRIELQRDMSLYGVSGDRNAVVIDGRSLNAAAVSVSFGRTGPVRIGRGSNTVEWLTVLANPSAAAGIAAELPGTAATRIRVAHLVSRGGSRGVDVRNVGSVNSNRRVDAEIVENEFAGPDSVIGMSEGIRIANFVAANGGVIVATMNGNRIHGFQLGCILANNRSSNARIEVRSSGDKFFGNGLGCFISGGLSQAGTPPANNTVTIFEGRGDDFVDNTAVLGPDSGGVVVVGGVSTTTANATSSNTVSVSLWGTRVQGNRGENFIAYGALKNSPPGIAGTNNHVTITLQGVSKKIEVVQDSSQPDDPLNTNTVTVIR